MIAAGTLRYPISLLTAQKTQVAGETRVTYSPPVSLLADVRQMSSAEQVRNGITTVGNTYAVRIRYRTDVKGDSRITYRGRTLDVIGVVEGGNREWLDITAKEAA